MNYVIMMHLLPCSLICLAQVEVKITVRANVMDWANWVLMKSMSGPLCKNSTCRLSVIYVPTDWACPLGSLSFRPTNQQTQDKRSWTEAFYNFTVFLKLSVICKSSRTSVFKSIRCPYVCMWLLEKVIINVDITSKMAVSVYTVQISMTCQQRLFWLTQIPLLKIAYYFHLHFVSAASCTHLCICTYLV